MLLKTKSLLVQVDSKKMRHLMRIIEVIKLRWSPPNEFLSQSCNYFLQTLFKLKDLRFHEIVPISEE